MREDQARVLGQAVEGGQGVPGAVQQSLQHLLLRLQARGESPHGLAQLARGVEALGLTQVRAISLLRREEHVDHPNPLALHQSAT